MSGTRHRDYGLEARLRTWPDSQVIKVQREGRVTAAMSCGGGEQAGCRRSCFPEGEACHPITGQKRVLRGLGRL